MDGTKIRTILFIVSLLNQANAQFGDYDFGNEYVNVAYKIFSFVLSLVAGTAALWFNNDFTPEAKVGTDVTHRLKEDPTLVVECYDPDEEDDGDDEDETEPAEAEADETIEEGEADEVEQK